MSESPILKTCLAEFRKIKSGSEAAIAQLADEHLHSRLSPLQNSVAVIMQHVAGNMVSRWTNFLTTDGEKLDRDRESEFLERRLPRAALLESWERGWRTLFESLGSLSDADLWRTVTIRGEPHTVFHAINRQTAHYSLHMGQIQVIAKHLVGPAWKYLSIPPGGSKEFNAARGIR